MGKTSKSEFSGLSALSLLGQVGMALAIPIVMGVLACRYVAKIFGGNGLVLAVIIFTSVAAGIVAAAMLVLRESVWKHFDDSD